MVFRLDIVGLSTDTKPTEGIQDGTTFYYVDTKKLFIFYKGTWYDQSEETEPGEETEPVEENADDQR